jgi:predicted nucleic acid-binding protein
VIHFLDTSAMAKRYVREPGSSTMRTALRRGTIVVARITYAELFAAIARAAREGSITEAHRAIAFARIEEDFRALSVVELRAAILQRVPALVVRHPLRAYDAVQLATALAVKETGALQLWTSDHALASAARQEGLRVAIPG